MLIACIMCVYYTILYSYTFYDKNDCSMVEMINLVYLS